MKKTMLALAALGALTSGSAFAQKAGDWVVGAGWFHLSPQDKSKPLMLTSPVQSVLAGSGASVSDSDTLGLNAAYFLDDHWAVEGVLGIPPKFKLEGTGTLARVGELGKARQWSPTILGKYYFNDGNAAFRPFVGLGATYVWYSGVQITSNLQEALGSQLRQRPLSTVTTAKLDSSFAPVLNAGLAYQFDKHWGISFSVSYIPLKTKAKLTTTSITGLPIATSEARLKLNPIVTYVAATYRF
ncbi:MULTISPECIES: OmpW family protein [unclassified Variovorax]|jgi:outer membrane protein|uniref:OmpW/AlkL family protein n=1 Tax=Variovorax TaxID=34072 RepID=UPI0008F11F3B|nr:MULTISPECIES: OmpW family outer membrane protein [unclassified Variovorax]KAF1070933.1 MAG: Outer membrane protein W [Variovorax sp.]TAJ67560.1 MAG: OmpW family protein [Variovorax sp.]SFP85809.1 outer membrane protein [Variovorax sp. PDC80]